MIAFIYNLRSQMERLFHVSETTVLKGRAIQNNLNGKWLKKKANQISYCQLNPVATAGGFLVV